MDPTTWWVFVCLEYLVEVIPAFERPFSLRSPPRAARVGCGSKTPSPIKPFWGRRMRHGCHGCWC
jgi:hypothetical protein